MYGFIAFHRLLRVRRRFKPCAAVFLFVVFGSRTRMGPTDAAVGSLSWGVSCSVVMCMQNSDHLVVFSESR